MVIYHSYTYIQAQEDEFKIIVETFNTSKMPKLCESERNGKPGYMPHFMNICIFYTCRHSINNFAYRIIPEHQDRKIFLTFLTPRCKYFLMTLMTIRHCIKKEGKRPRHRLTHYEVNESNQTLYTYIPMITF